VPSRKAQARRLALIAVLRAWGDRLAPAAAFVGLIAIWEGACRLFAIPSFLLPSPSAIAQAGLEVSATQWLGHIGATLRVALMGYAAAIAISIPLAIALVKFALPVADPLSDPGHRPIDTDRRGRADHRRDAGRVRSAAHRDHVPDRLFSHRGFDGHRPDGDT